MKPTYPSMIVLEPPGYPTSGSHKYRCMICTKFWRISDRTYTTVRDMRRDQRMYIVVCFGCFQDLEPKLPTEMLNGRQEATTAEARQIMGYR